MEPKFISGTKAVIEEATPPVREAADPPAAVLRDSALPVLRAGRWYQENPLANRSQPAGKTTPEFSVGTAVWLGGPEILRKLLEKKLLDITCFFINYVLATTGSRSGLSGHCLIISESFGEETV
jgi:hypothetical protein